MPLSFVSCFSLSPVDSSILSYREDLISLDVLETRFVPVSYTTTNISTHLRRLASTTISPEFVIMKTQAIILAALAVAPSALAHTVWSTFYVDGKDQVNLTNPYRPHYRNTNITQGAGVAMRMRKDPAKASFPLEDYGSTDMACSTSTLSRTSHQ